MIWLQGFRSESGILFSISIPNDFFLNLKNGKWNLVMDKTTCRKCKTIYELLEAVHKRPGLYLGGRSFHMLQGFISGIAYADLDPGGPSFWEYNRWITARIDGISLNLPWDWIEEMFGNDQAFSLFFAYLEEYRQCRLVTLKLTGNTEPDPKFRVVNTEGKQLKPPKPDQLCIGQYAPSDVYFLGELYGETIKKDFPYFRSIKAVMDEAKLKWGVNHAVWKSI